MNQPASPKVLVVYFSRTGRTRKVAEAIAQAADADLEELRESRSRRGILGWLRSGYEGSYRLSSHPLPPLREPNNYQVVIIGSPTWHRSLSSPVRGFLEQYGKSLTDVALFATCAQRGADEVLAQMAELLPKAPLATLQLRETEVVHGPAVEVGEFVESSLVSWEKRHPAEPRQMQSAQCSG
jgi:flavodoxin